MPGETTTTVQPPVEWAQRKDLLYVTIRFEDCKCSAVDCTEDKLVVKGVGGAKPQQPFECNLEFYKPIDNSKMRRVASDRSVEFVIPKKETGPFWPRLLKSTAKFHWLKIDFNKWKDEDDESDPENANWDLNDMMGKMGGIGGGEKPDLDDFDDDSDNAELPDLEDDKDEEDQKAGGENVQTSPSKSNDEKKSAADAASEPAQGVKIDS